jgi:outer membrane protein assembly factor BamB
MNRLWGGFAEGNIVWKPVVVGFERAAELRLPVVLTCPFRKPAMKRTPVICLSLLALLVAAPLHAADWTQFRGPGGSGVGSETGLPVKWSATENLVWRTKLPGPGTSSPIVLKDRIYLTCYTGYGVSQEDPGDMDNLVRHVVCLDRKGGKILWKKEFKSEGRESRYGGNGAKHGYSSSTPTTDGKFLYVFFGKAGVYCLKLEDGSQVWHTSVGDRIDGWGSSTSPILYKDLLILNASVENKSVVALNKKTSKQVWSYPGVRKSWGTPVIVKLPDGKAELALSVPRKIIGIDPSSGKELWTCEGISDGYICPSVVAHDGVVYAIGGRRRAAAIAGKAGGRGDVTATHRLWSVSNGSKVTSPVYDNGRLCWVHSERGTAYCLNAKTGETVYESRLAPRPGIVYSSVIVADGKIYCVSQHKGTYVLAAGPKFELLAHNTFADDDSRSNAGPVVSNGQLLIRSDKYLYCIGKQAADK